VVRKGGKLIERGANTAVHAESANWKRYLWSGTIACADAPVDTPDEKLLFVRVRLCVLSSVGEAVK